MMIPPVNIYKEIAGFTYIIYIPCIMMIPVRMPHAEHERRLFHVSIKGGL